MTREELKAHCKKQIEMCEMWAKAKGEKPCGKVYEEHKMILELLEEKPYEDWYDVPSDEMTLEQTRQAVRDLRKKLAECLEQQPCEDCISRQAVLDGLASIAKVKARSDAQKSLMGRIMFFVEQLPPVTPEGKTGKWIDDEFGSKCSRCGTYTHLDKFDRPMKFKYCSMCGAKMQEVENEDSD